jgi:hypothetical protein
VTSFGYRRRDRAKIAALNDSLFAFTIHTSRRETIKIRPRNAFAEPMTTSHTADCISEVDRQANFICANGSGKSDALHIRRDAATTESLNAIRAFESG